MKCSECSLLLDDSKCIACKSKLLAKWQNLFTISKPKPKLVEEESVKSVVNPVGRPKSKPISRSFTGASTRTQISLSLLSWYV